MATEKRVSQAERGYCGAVDHAKRLLAFGFYSQLPALLCRTSRYTLDDDSFLKYNAVKQLQRNASALPCMLALSSHKVVHALHIDQSAVQRPRKTKLDSDIRDVRPPASFPEVRLFLKDRLEFAYKAEVLWLRFVHSSFAKKREPPCSMIKTGRQSKKVTRARLGEEEMKTGVESSAKLENVIDAPLAAFRALQPKTESSFQVWKMAVRDNRLDKDTSFDEAEDLYEL